MLCEIDGTKFVIVGVVESHIFPGRLNDGLRILAKCELKIGSRMGPLTFPVRLDQRVSPSVTVCGGSLNAPWSPQLASIA